jgi:hypothetical protein
VHRAVGYRPCLVSASLASTPSAQAKITSPMDAIFSTATQGERGLQIGPPECGRAEADAAPLTASAPECLSAKAVNDVSSSPDSTEVTVSKLPAGKR